MKLLKEVLEGIRPKDKSLTAEADATIRRLNTALRKDGIKATAIKGGSMEKDTHLAIDHDCDIFVKFDMRYRDEDISKLLGKTVKKTFPKVRKLHGSRDYYQFDNRLNYEIVPVLEIKSPEEALNVTDCSPLHSVWVKKFPKMNDEIRLAKAFSKSCGTYGAESYIKGFSGHVIDILTIYYKGFLNLLKGAAKWKEKQVIDLYNMHKGKALFNLNQSKTTSALIVIDPIQSDRNAAAALSAEKMEIFRQKAKEFLKRPDKSFFMKHTLSMDDVKDKAKGCRLIMIKVMPVAGKRDVVGAKLLKAYEMVGSELKDKGFEVRDSGWEWDKADSAFFYFMIGKKGLSEYIIREGPPLSRNDFVIDFRKKNKNTYIKGNKIYAKIKRKYVDPYKLVGDVLKTNYIKEKVKETRIEK